MTVHIGEVTSEVRTPAPAPPEAMAAGGGSNPWEERVRIAGLLDRLAGDRCRTATGPLR